MDDRTRYQAIYDEAYEYLLSFDRVDAELIDRHLLWGERDEPDSLNEVYAGLLIASKNRQGMPNSIGDVSQLEEPLYGFEPVEVTENYGSWQDFFETVENREEISPPGRFVIENERSHWVQYSKSVLSGAEFLSQFSDIGEFNEFVGDFTRSGYTRYSLPLLLSKRIHGLGFALACDFLKENGYPQFVKPDVHIKELFDGLGLSDGDDDFEIFLDVIEFAETIDELPYRVDKLFWLVGSGRFYLAEPEFRVPTSKPEFVDRVNSSVLQES